MIEQGGGWGCGGRREGLRGRGRGGGDGDNGGAELDGPFLRLDGAVQDEPHGKPLALKLHSKTVAR